LPYKGPNTRETLGGKNPKGFKEKKGFFKKTRGYYPKRNSQKIIGVNKGPFWPGTIEYNDEDE